MKYNSFLLMYILLLNVCLLLNACSLSRNWQGTSTLQSTQAQFDELTGKQAFTVLVPDNDTYLKYHFTVNRGKLETTIQSPTTLIFSKELSAIETDSIHLVNQKGTKYTIYLKGKQASGGFDIRFADSRK